MSGPLAGASIGSLLSHSLTLMTPSLLLSPSQLSGICSHPGTGVFGEFSGHGATRRPQLAGVGGGEFS